jgi:hypothetical protein
VVVLNEVEVNACVGKFLSFPGLEEVAPVVTENPGLDQDDLRNG